MVVVSLVSRVNLQRGQHAVAALREIARPNAVITVTKQHVSVSEIIPVTVVS